MKLKHQTVDLQPDVVPSILDAYAKVNVNIYEKIMRKIYRTLCDLINQI